MNRVATSLRSMGVNRGDRVALFATDSPEYMEIVLACTKLGAVYVPLNFRLAEPEVAALLRVADAKVLFFSERYAGLVAAAASPGLVCVSIDGHAGDRSYVDLLVAGIDSEIDTPCSDGELLSLAFTSGTTSLPKAVMHSQRMMKHVVMQCAIERRMANLMFHYSAAPLYHVGGMLYAWSCVLLGRSALILPSFDPDVVVRWMGSGRLDGVFLVPT